MFDAVDAVDFVSCIMAIFYGNDRLFCALLLGFVWSLYVCRRLASLDVE